MKLGANDIDNFAIGADGVDAIYLGTDNVWSAYDGEPSPLIITANGDFTAGIDFPANKNITVCCVGGGGGGAATTSNVYAGGGHQGQIIQEVIRVPKEEVVTATIGGGGGTVSGGDRTGIAGTASTFGSYINANGGAGGTVNSSSGGYSGAGAGHESPCDGETWNDGVNTNSGSAWGGQWGAYGNGGRDMHYNPAGAGGVGAGGGGVSRSNGGGEASGRGGRGQIVISWD